MVCLKADSFSEELSLGAFADARTRNVEPEYLCGLARVFARQHHGNLFLSVGRSSALLTALARGSLRGAIPSILIKEDS